MDDWFVTDPDDSAPPGPAESLWMFDDGAVWDLGPAELDTDGDGVADSLVGELDGRHVMLTDSDGDGRVDRIVALDADGEAVVTDATAERPLWSPTSLGRLE